MSTSRNSNFELLRIIAMIFVVLVHANGYSIGLPRKEDIVNTPFESFFRLFFEQMSKVCVNVFVLISAWFGIKPSVKKAADLLFQVLFIVLVVASGAKIVGTEFSIKQLEYCIFFGAGYWFVPAYLIMFALAPAINTFVESQEKKIVRGVVIAYFLLQTIYGWDIDFICINQGYSAISFIGLYLLGRYFSVFEREKINRLSFKGWLLMYFILTIIPASIIYVGTKFGFGHVSKLCTYISPFVIAAALSLIFAFSRINFKNKFVNCVAKSVFAVYLFHLHPAISFQDIMYKHFTILGGANI